MRGESHRCEVRKLHDYDGGSDGSPATVAAAPQCLRALEHANHVRLARAEVKHGVKAGRLSVGDVILACPWQVRTMAVSELLVSQRSWGRTRTRRLLLSLRVPENKPVGTLTERQRVALAAMLMPLTLADAQARA